MANYGARAYGSGPYGADVSFPTLTVEVAFVTDPTAATPTWTDITAYVLEIETTRGRQFEVDQMQPGTATLVLDNSDRRFDPTYTHSAYYPNVLPMRKIRISAVWNAITYRVFTGYVERWPVVYAEAGASSTVSITARDGFTALSASQVVATANMAVAAGIDTGFEAGTTGWTVSNGTLSRVTTGQQNGLGAGKMFAHATLSPSAAIPGTSGTLSLGLVAGNWYEFSCWIFVPSGLGITLANIGMYFRQDGVATIGATAASAFDTWQQHGFTMAVAPSSTQAWIEIRLAETGATKYIVFEEFHAAPTASRGDPALGALVGTTTTSADGSAATQGVRIGELLNAANWPTADRLLDAGTTTVPSITLAATDNADALTQILDTADAGLGSFYINGAGQAVFQDRVHRYDATSQVTFADTTTGATRITYTDFVPSFDVDHLANSVQVTATGSSNVQQADDTTSQTHYFRRVLSRNVNLATDAEAFQQASFLLSQYKDARLRVDRLATDAFADDNTWPHVLGRELGDLITVERNPDMLTGLAAETISKPCFIEQIQHSIRMNALWTTTYQLSPADRWTNVFRLDSSALDDVNAVLAYA